MNIIKKSTLFAAIVLSSSYCLADIYNHGNHNDNQILFGTNSNDTINCGNSSLAVCISGANLTNISQQWCRNKVVDDTDGPLQYGQSYYHSVQSYALHIMSAIDQDGQGNTNDYIIDVQYSCSGLFHPGKKTIELSE